MTLPASPTRPTGPGQELPDALAEVEALMLRLVAGGRRDPSSAIAAEHLAAGGRRMRAWLALEAAEALGVPLKAAAGWAAACELLHNASLVHDDIQDQDTVRRGAPTAWARHGLAQALTAGDLLLMLPVLALGEVAAGAATRWRLAEALCEHAARAARGQSLELSLRAARAADRAAYDQAARGKTGAFFALPAYGAALLAGLEAPDAERIGRAFEDLGLLYQIADDVVDLYADKGRGAGGDVREGRVSALVVEHLRLHPGDGDWLWAILDRPGAETTSEDVAAVSRRFREGGALDAALTRIGELAAAVEDSPLARYPALRATAQGLLAQVLAPLAQLRLSAGSAR